ncbi:MAG: universal stress protein [Gemmatimonadaceae bacterium]
MPGPVMVALDGSERDPRALAVAVGLADLAHAPLHLVHVIDEPSDSEVAQGAFLGLDRSAVSGRRGVATHLSETASRVSGATGHPVTFDIPESGRVIEELVQRAVLHDASVLVMATRAPSALELALIGGVTERVVRESPRPVVVVPPGSADMQDRHVRFSRVLVPLDGSALSGRALELLMSWPGAAALEYVLLEVVPSRGDTSAAEQRLAAARDRVRARGATAVEVRTVESDDAARAICDAVRDDLVDIIAMTTRGASGLQRLAVGSVAEGVVKASDVPLLLLTPASLGAAA